MNHFLAGILLVWSYMSILVAALPQNTTDIIITASTELSSEVSRTFLACLQNTRVEYKVYVDYGVTVVIPATKRDLDFDGVDKKLDECIKQVCHLMSVAVESALYDQDEHANAVASHSITHEWLSKQGAHGLTEVGTQPATINPANNSTAVVGSGRGVSPSERSAKRQTGQPFNSFPSDWSNCESADFQTDFVAPNCPNVWSP